MKAIEFKNVSFRYEDMPEPVLKNASFSLEYGKMALLYGDSGQGKSTVLSILSGVIPNVTKGTLSGEVCVGGEDVSGQRISDICRRAGVVLQNADAQIIHQRVEDELAFGCENFSFSPEKIGGCIEKACRRLALCPQWGTRTLSGGQKQRLITASALVTEQRILLLDEPLANLDRKGAAFLMASLRTLTESGYAVLIVEHRLEQVLPFAHEVWRLRNGSLERQTGRESLCAAQPEAAELIPAEARREEPVMTLHGVGWRAGGRSILEGVDLTLFRGERLLLIGDNGCGKTSLLRLMARLARPTAGDTAAHRPRLGAAARQSGVVSAGWCGVSEPKLPALYADGCPGGGFCRQKRGLCAGGYGAVRHCASGGATSPLPFRGTEAPGIHCRRGSLSAGAAAVGRAYRGAGRRGTSDAASSAEPFAYAHRQHHRHRHSRPPVCKRPV